MAAILLVEPESAERTALIEALGRAGHAVALAQTGEEALERAREGRGELIILDEAARPGGVEIARRWKAEAPGFSPVLVIVSRPDSLPAALAVADDAVARPFSAAEVTARALALLRTQKTIESLLRARGEAETHAFEGAGLRNRVFLVERLTEEYKRSVRYNEPLSLLLVGVGGLDELTQARGSTFVDRVLAEVGLRVERALRQIDVVGRYGPGEVGAILPNTHFAGSLVCADRLTRELPSVPIEDFVPRPTMGIAFCPGTGVAEPADLMRFASRALERARAEGPGNICLYQHQGYLYQPK